MRHSESALDLEGIYFSETMTTLVQLVEPCWFTHLWHLCSMFQSPIQLLSKYEVLLMREREDIALMDVFIETGIWQIG